MASTFASARTDLHETLTQLYVGDQGVNDTSLNDFSKDKKEALSKPSEPQQDADKGPFEAWWAANKELPLHSSLVMDHTAGFRDWAHVLWDEDRLKRYSLLTLLTENAPESELVLQDKKRNRVLWKNHLTPGSKSTKRVVEDTGKKRQ